jgi:AmmeMemoRadiSam system protein B/AmmeMemoRadiSam system protein A
MKLKGITVCFLTLVVAWAWGFSYAYDTMGQRVRPSAVAGMFYPSDANELRKAVRVLLKDASGVKVQGKVRALISPHAGYIYSGIVAAAGYKQIDPSTKTVILLGSSHHVRLRGASMPKATAYETPLGDVHLADISAVFQELPLVEAIPRAHDREHSLEVQLPFLQVMLKDFQIVPILTNNADPGALASALAPHIDDHTLVVASSDLSHYYSYDTAKSLDRICTNAIIGSRFSDMTLCEACGKEAVLTLMHIAKIKGWDSTLIDYRNSGDTAGDKARVVGYASIAFVDRKEISSKMKEDLSAQDKEGLLRLARSAIEAKLIEGAKVQRPELSSPALLEDRGCFVTLHKDGQLRGCIGMIEPVSPLVECVEGNAKSAAFRDPRFPSLSAEELTEIDIEVSVLTVPKKLDFKDGEDLKRQLQPLVHGVILSRGHKRSTFLPQVWKQLPDKEQFLEHLCLKGGMSSKAWKDPKTEVKVYKALVFGEENVK